MGALLECSDSMSCQPGQVCCVTMGTVCAVCPPPPQGCGDGCPNIGGSSSPAVVDAGLDAQADALPDAPSDAAVDVQADAGAGG